MYILVDKTEQIQDGIKRLKHLFNDMYKETLYRSAAKFIDGVMAYYIKHKTITLRQANSILNITQTYTKSCNKFRSTLGGNGDPDDIDMDGRYEDQPY